MKLKLNSNLKSHKKDDIISIDDKEGIPTDIYWRNRLKDSEIDNCVEIINENKKEIVEKKIEPNKVIENIVAGDDIKILEVKHDNSK